jgi:hypothetical protein
MTTPIPGPYTLGTKPHLVVGADGQFVADTRAIWENSAVDNAHARLIVDALNMHAAHAQLLEALDAWVVMFLPIIKADTEGGVLMAKSMAAIAAARGEA